MLKEVMLGAGGILLAAAIFASSVTPGTAPGNTTSAAATPPAPVATVQPPRPVQSVVSSRPDPVFEEDSGDMQFGAPMVSAKPLSAASTAPPPIVTDPDSALANGGRQFNSRPGRPYPTPE